jgi:hypothetical protein
METVLAYRQSIVDLLRSISDLDPRLGPVEMVCCWFDDLYLPADDSKHATSEAWTRGLKEWEACFSPSELDALSAFHAVFDSVVKELDDSPLSYSSDQNWHKVSAAASRTLLAFQTHVA